MSCGPLCCAVSSLNWSLNKQDIADHVNKHADGSCPCDLCTHRLAPRTYARREALEACAAAGMEAVGETWGKDAVIDAVAVSCAEQIVSGRYRNELVAEPAFVEAVLREAFKQPALLGK